jgi:hypothetical protein
MSCAVSTRPILQACKHLRDEFSSRRSSFRSGSPIQLSDGQTWIVPLPPQESERKAEAFGSAYTDIIQAILEAEDSSEQCVGELAFAIFLLEYNYYLSPADYQRLLASGTNAPSTINWQSAFHRIAQEHFHVFRELTDAASENGARG